jgi:hypothetical protein
VAGLYRAQSRVEPFPASIDMDAIGTGAERQSRIVRDEAGNAVFLHQRGERAHDLLFLAFFECGGSQ